uniref:Uncharacterized protein n=1 Tax=Panagrolaimus sp. JU765 TaxID=591449 RepID=A0AC34RLU3_9BILA
MWKNIPVDGISGICHIGAGDIEHWLTYYLTIGGFILLIIISWLIIMYKKIIQTKRLNQSMKNQQKLLISSIEIDENETKNLKIDDEKEDVNSYVLENGLGDGLIPDYWLGSIFGAIVLTFFIGGFLQSTILNGKIGENYEREMIKKSIHCSLKTLTTEYHTNWWNKTINYDHLTTIFDPYKRKEMLFDSVTAPGCEFEILKETKLLTIFFTSIILPCLPYWILAVCFFAGFCNNGLKSVRKIRTKFNPFLYEKVKNNELNLGFLQSTNDTKNIKEDIEMQSQSTAPTRATAPPIMQTESIIEENEFGLPSLNDTTSTAVIAIIEENEYGLPSLNDTTSTAVIGASSVHSEPITNNIKFKSSRKIDLTKRYREYRRERIQNEQLLHTAIFNGSMSSRFTDEICPSTQSEFNMTSISNHCLPKNLRMNNGYTMVDLITKYEEAQKQNTQLLLENRETRQTLKQLQESYSDIKDCIKTLLVKVDNSSTSTNIKPEILLEKNKKETVDLLNNLTESYSDLRETVQMLSTKLIKELSDDDEKSNIKKPRKKSLSPKGKKSEFAKKSAKQPIIEVSPLEIVAGDISSGDEDDLPQINVASHWSLPNPPPEVLQYRCDLMTGEKKYDVEYPSEQEIFTNLFYRLMAHCTNGLPQWLKNPYVHACRENFEELYLENDDKSTIFSERKIYPDTEAIEAAGDPNLIDFIFPIICQAIAQTCVDFFMDTRWLFRSVSPWVSEPLDLTRFEMHVMNAMDADLCSVPEEMEVDVNHTNQIN